MEAMFGEFFYPDGTQVDFNSVMELQKFFMEWFRLEREKELLTFPVLTSNILEKEDGTGFMDENFVDYCAEEMSKGLSFFVYQSDSADSLSSCCFDGSQMTLTKSSNGINYMTFEDLYNTYHDDNIEIFHNGSWTEGKVVRIPKNNHKMYKVVTDNNKEIVVTNNHINCTANGDKETSQLTTDDYLLFNTKALESYTKNSYYDYDKGVLFGAFLTGEKSIPKNVLSYSKEYRQGIIDWLRLDDDNYIQSTSFGFIQDLEAILTSLGKISTIDKLDTGYCIRWNDDKEFVKIKSIEEVDYNSDFVYCFEMTNQEEPYFTLPNGIITHNCRLKNELADNDFSYTLGAGGVVTGSCQVITINANRLFQRFGGFDELPNLVDRLHRYLTAFKAIYRSYIDAGLVPTYTAGIMDLDKQFITIGVNGLVEAAEYVGLSATNNEDYKEFLAKFLSTIKEKNTAYKLATGNKVNTEFVPKACGDVVG